METQLNIEITQRLNKRYRVLTDHEVNRTDRIGFPMVWVFSGASMDLTREWQYYLRAINPGMTPEKVCAVLGYRRAFTNQNGFGNVDDPRRNYILNEDLDANELPKFDKVRTCGMAELEMISGVVTMMDGTKPPPLKPGVSQPETLRDATLEKYLFTPRGNPSLFFACVSTGSDLNPNPFPQGVTYPWYKGGTTPVVFLPHVSPVKITYPPEAWTDNTPTLTVL